MISATRLATRAKTAQRREPTRQPISARRAQIWTLIVMLTTARTDAQAPKTSCKGVGEGSHRRRANELTLNRQAKSLAMSRAPRTPPTIVQRILSNGREARASTSTMMVPMATLRSLTRGPTTSSVALWGLRQPNQQLASQAQSYTLSLTEFRGDWSDQIDGDGEDNLKRVFLGVFAIVTSSDRINWHTSGRRGRSGEDDEGQGGEGRKTEETHCE